MKFILEQVKGARYKLAEYRYIKADQQLSSVQLYCEESIEKYNSPQNLPKADAYSLLAEVRAIYDELLEDAMYLYQYYPNNFRKTAEEYFKKEIEMQKKISEHFS